MPKADFPSESALRSAADKLGCRVQTIQAIAKVEAGPYGAFLDSGEPVILFEPHVFGRITKHRYDGYAIETLTADTRRTSLSRDIGFGVYPKWCYLSYKTWRLGWYGNTKQQHWRLHAATKLDRDAALKSCSWGLYQLMGFNHKLCGHETIQSFVNAMYRSVDDHLQALVSFVLSDPRKVKAVRDRDAKTFARLYNGASYAKNKYNTRLIAAGF